MAFDNTIGDAKLSSAPTYNAALRSVPNVRIGLQRGVCRRCPACGKGRLFCGYLTILKTCVICGNNNGQYPSDDFAPYVTILLILHMLLPVLLFVDRASEMSGWFVASIAIPIMGLATLVVLPFAKGSVIGLAWAVDVIRDPTEKK